MSMSIKKSRLFKLLAVAALAMVMAIGTALPSFASSDDKVFFFSTEENYAKEAFISPALIKETRPLFTAGLRTLRTVKYHL